MVLGCFAGSLLELAARRVDASRGQLQKKTCEATQHHIRNKLIYILDTFLNVDREPEINQRL